MPRKKSLKAPVLPAEDTAHGYKWRKEHRPGGRRPPHLIEHAHRLTPLELLDAGVKFPAVGRPLGPMRTLVHCPRCGARRQSLFTHPACGQAGPNRRGGGIVTVDERRAI